MPETNGTPPKPERTPFDRFRELARKVIQVPKAEIDKQEAEYQKKRAGKPKRGPKPKAERKRR